MDVLYKAAIAKTHDADKAEELTQETYLHALQAVAKGTVIQSPKAYLLSVLHNRFYMYLREKYKLSSVYYEDLPVDSYENEDISEAIILSEEAAAVRRELAFLSHTYREVRARRTPLCRFYDSSFKRLKRALKIC